MPNLDRAVIARIRAGAHGLPLYLDLSLAMARTAANAGADLAPEAFGGPLPELVAHIFADLPPGEREIARCASLIPRFSPALVAKAAGRPVGDAQRFCRRALVTQDQHELFPYRLHDAVRAAIADESVTAPGAWASVDRRDCAMALIQEFRQVHDAEIDNPGHRREVLELVAGLCDNHDLQVPWVLDALVDLPGMAQTALWLPTPDSGTWIGHVSRFFGAYRWAGARQRIDYLEQLVEEPLPPDVHTTAWRFLAYALRTVDGGTETEHRRALSILRSQLNEQPDSPLLRYQVARTLHVLGDLAGLADHLARYPLIDPTQEMRLKSDLAYQNGEIAEAMDGASARAEHLRSVGRHRVALETQAVALWRAALIGRTTIARCEASIEEADRYGMLSPMRTAMAAKGICVGGDDDAMCKVLEESKTVVEALSGRPGWREWALSIIRGLRFGVPGLISQTRSQWESDTRPPTYNYRMVDHLFVYAGYPATYPPVNGNIDQANIDRRWHQVVDTLLNNRGA